jgi:hypothetical protein
LKLRVLLLAGSVLLLGLVSLLLPAAAAAEDTRRLAVLELSGSLNRDVLSVLSDQLRQGALKALKGTAYEVMTRENMAIIARDNGIDLAACQDGAECEVDIGRSIGADIIISGAVTRVGSSMVASLKLHSTARGTLLDSQTVKSSNEEGLLDKLPASATALLHEGLGLGLGRRSRSRSAAPSTAKEGAIGEQSSSFSLGSSVQEEVVRFESTPPGAVVLLNGDLLCSATPCRKRVEAGSYRVSMQMERYHPASQDVVVKSGMSAVAVSLKRKFARLTVTTKPPGLAILLNGKKVGESGLQSRELDPGAYELLVDERCYLRSGERVVLKEGQDRTVEIVAKQRKTGLRVDVEDSAGNVLDGQVWVDGENLGDAPGPFELPLCSQKVEMKSAGAGVWSAALKLQENQITELPVVLAASPTAGERAMDPLSRNAFTKENLKSRSEVALERVDAFLTEQKRRYEQALRPESSWVVHCADPLHLFPVQRDSACAVTLDGAEGLSAGSLLIRPGIAVGLVYDSNVFRSQLSPEADFGIQIQPNIHLTYPGANFHWTFDAYYRFFTYFNAPRPGVVNHDGLRVDDEFKVATRLNVNRNRQKPVGVQFEPALFHRESPGGGAIGDKGIETRAPHFVPSQSSPGRQWGARAPVSLLFRPHPAFQIHLDGHWNWARTELLNDYPRYLTDIIDNHNVVGGGGGVSWRFFGHKEATQLRFSAQVRRVLWGASNYSVTQVNTTLGKLWLGVEAGVAPQFSFEAFLGYGNVLLDPGEPGEYDALALFGDGEVKGIKGLLGRVEFVVMPLKSQRLRFGFKRDVRFRYFTHRIIETQTHFNYRGLFFERLQVDADFSFTHRDLAGWRTRLENQWSGGFSVWVFLKRWLRVGGGPRFNNIDPSSTNEGEYIDNRVTVGLRFGG